MVDPFDIFRAEANGSVVWLGVAEDFDRAKARVQSIGVSKPGTYIILSQASGSTISVQVNAHGELTIRTAQSPT